MADVPGDGETPPAAPPPAEARLRTQGVPASGQLAGEPGWPPQGRRRGPGLHTHTERARPAQRSLLSPGSARPSGCGSGDGTATSGVHPRLGTAQRALLCPHSRSSAHWPRGVGWGGRFEIPPLETHFLGYRRRGSQSPVKGGGKLLVYGAEEEVPKGGRTGDPGDSPDMRQDWAVGVHTAPRPGLGSRSSLPLWRAKALPAHGRCPCPTLI